MVVKGGHFVPLIAMGSVVQKGCSSVMLAVVRLAGPIGPILELEGLRSVVTVSKGCLLACEVIQ